MGLGAVGCDGGLYSCSFSGTREVVGAVVELDLIPLRSNNAKNSMYPTRSSERFRNHKLSLVVLSVR